MTTNVVLNPPKEVVNGPQGLSFYHKRGRQSTTWGEKSTTLGLKFTTRGLKMHYKGLKFDNCANAGMFMLLCKRAAVFGWHLGPACELYLCVLLLYVYG